MDVPRCPVDTWYFLIHRRGNVGNQRLHVHIYTSALSPRNAPASTNAVVPSSLYCANRRAFYPVPFPDGFHFCLLLVSSSARARPCRTAHPFCSGGNRLLCPADGFSSPRNLFVCAWVFDHATRHYVRPTASYAPVAGLYPRWFYSPAAGERRSVRPNASFIGP